MQVMTNHKWHDKDIHSVWIDNRTTLREIMLCEDAENCFYISRNDVIALAKEFGLVVYKQNAAL